MTFMVQSMLLHGSVSFFRNVTKSIYEVYIVD